MSNSDVKQSIKVGGFVIGGLLVFFISVFFIGKESSIFNKTFVISAVFKNVEGLQKGDNVWLSGVKIGTVKSVEIFKEGQVIVNLNLREKQNDFIRKNATASIGSDGFIGNKIVVIRPGDSSQPIGHQDTIKSLSPTDTQDVINIAKEVGENAKSLTGDLKQILSRINKGEGLVGELLTEGQLSKDVRSTVAHLNQTGANAERASAEMASLISAMKNGDGLLPTLISDTTFTNTFEQAVGNVKKVSESAAEVAATLRNVTARMNDNNNAVGVLLSDTTTALKLKETAVNVDAASAKLDQNMEALKHNFLLRGYFRKQAKKEKKEKEAAEKAAKQ